MSKIDDLAKIVGPKGVVTDKDVLSSFAMDNSFVSGKIPQCVVRPRNMGEVQGIIKLATLGGLSLIPCSSKGPRFRGDTIPVADDAVIVDLSGMDSIIRIDKRNKVAMIEPGVTFGGLSTAVEKEGLRVVMPLLPRKTKSAVASILEREPTTIPKYHWDMSDPMCCIEVIFGTGDMFRTGSAAGPGTLEEQWASGQAQKSPMGPSQSDFMKIMQGSQGTMGIVTWASVKLELLPKIQKAFFVAAQDLSELIDFTYRILRPKLPDICLILNRTDLVSIYGGNKPANDLPPWVLFYSISGYEYLPEERVDYIEKDIADIAGQTRVKSEQSIAGISAGNLLGLISKPSGDPYWKLRSRGGCEDIFFLTTLDRAPEFVKAMNDEIKKHGFPEQNLGVYIQPIQQGRNCHIEFNLMYDPKGSEEMERVERLFDSASKALMDMGGFFSRPYGQWSHLAYSKCLDTVTALKKVKGILDPKGVMNPGKLCFAKEE